ncbi:hypothetical protein [Neisseria arctica]|uniref:hypothetical protein n=1 Tax=Neisseria arctica TaxID=1470200 RepID=UPI001910F0E7|nr:hypothetical protein [Neisseria arctica]UOO86505.1 hypothetical protein LVJ86_10000 [Neisseria arctica]
MAQGDIVVVPLYRSITIGKVSGAKRFVEEEVKHDACNQVAVEFFCDQNGKVIQLPRSVLSHGLESRLKIRMTIARLNGFLDEIEKLIRSLKENGSYQQSSYLLK